MVFDYFIELKRKRAIKKQARRDYETARGTAHLALLKRARKRIAQKVKKIDQEIKQNQSHINELKREKANALVQALEEHIAYTRLTEVPGIGEKLSDTLLSRVFVSRLSDLQRAYLVPGIGEARQRDINHWIRHYEGLKSQMLVHDFPGKRGVLGTYDPSIRSINEVNDSLKAAKKKLIERQDLAEAYIKKLEQVSQADFENALLTPGSAHPELDEYTKGLFPEWDPVPDWFKTLVAEGE